MICPTRDKRVKMSLRTPDPVEFRLTQFVNTSPEMGAREDGFGGSEFITQVADRGIVGRLR